MLTLSLDRIAYTLGPLTIHWYGVFVALGFFAGMVILKVQARKIGVSAVEVSDLAVACVVGGIVGARILYVLLNFGYYLKNPFEIIRIDQGGLVFYGGFFGALIVVSWLVRRKKLPFWASADIFAFALPAGQAIGRIGCLLNGCCFGRPTDNVPSILYTIDATALNAGVAWDHSAAKLITEVQHLRHELPPFEPHCLPVLPAQISQSLINVGIFLALVIAARKIRRPGRIAALFVILYSLGRFTNECFRGDYLALHWGGHLTIAQVICIFLLPAGIALFWWLGKNQEAPPEIHDDTDGNEGTGK